MKRGMFILVLIVWFCASFGKCKAQTIDGTLRTNHIADSTTIWHFDSTGNPAQITVLKERWHIIPRQNVVIQGWDTTEIIYLKDRLGNAGWDAKASADTISFYIPPKVIKIGDGIYKTLFLNGHWVLLWDPKSK